jgi:hypothetical protein
VTPPVSHLRERLAVTMASIASVQSQTTDPSLQAHLAGIQAELWDLAVDLEAITVSTSLGRRGGDRRADETCHDVPLRPRLVTIWRRMSNG